MFQKRTSVSSTQTLKLLAFNCQAPSQTISHRVAHRLTKIGVDCRNLRCDCVFHFFDAYRVPRVL